MRDLLNKLQLLDESTGLANRRPGEIFRNPNGDEITFNEVKFFPEEGGKLEPAELDTVLQQVNAQTNNSIEWMNDRKPKSDGGFALISFDSPDGERFFGKYFKEISPSLNNALPNVVADYKLASKSAVKMRSGLTPQDLLSKLNNLTVNEILKQLYESETIGPNNPLYLVAKKLASGESLPMTFPAPEGVSFTAFRDYFCEILQPIALQNGQYTGNAEKATEIFLDGSFQNTLISFDFAKNAGLSDSAMTNSEGGMIKISSKGKKGAEASTSNLVSSLDELLKSPSGKEIFKKYPDIVEMLREIKRRGQAESPLYLGVKFGVIDENEAVQIRNLKNKRPMNMDDIESFGLSPNLVELAKSKNPKKGPNNVKLYFHLIAAVAKKSAETINEKTNFSKAASEILSNGALIQVYTKAKEGKSEWTLTGFDTQWPGSGIKGVNLSSEKNYMSTNIKGNYTFMIDRGEGFPIEDQAEDQPTTVATTRAKRQQSEKEFAQTAKDIASGGAPTKKNKKLPTGDHDGDAAEKAAGRKFR